MSASDTKLPWWKRRVEFGPKLGSEEFGRAIQANLGLQFVLIALVGGMILDGGVLAGMLAVAAAYYWIVAAPILMRRRFAASRGEMTFLRIGFIAFIPVSVFTMPLWGWLRELFK